MSHPASSATSLIARPLSRRSALRTLGLAGAALGGLPLLNACSPAPAAPTSAPAQSAPRATGAVSTLRVGHLPITDAAALLVAHGRGFYQQNGLEAPTPTLFRGWAQIAEAFQARQVDVVHLLMPMTVQLRFGQQYPLKVIAWAHVNGSALTVAPNVQTIEDLAGTTVAIPFWFSIHNVVLQQLFKKANLTPIIRGDADAAARTVKLVVMAPPDMPPALGQGTIKGYIVAEPFNALAEVGQVGKILRFTGDAWRDHACCVVVMHEDTVQQKPEYVQATVNAVAQAQRYLRENRPAAAELLSKDGNNYLPQPKAVIERAMGHYPLEEYGPTGAIQNPEWGSSRIDFQPFPYASYTHQLVTLLKETTVDGDAGFLPGLNPEQTHTDLVAESFARAAVPANGGPATFGIAEGFSRTEQIAL